MSLSAASSLLHGYSLRWLVTGAAGFIGSNIVEALLGAGQQVVGFDNFATGHRRNLHGIRQRLGEAFDRNFRFVEGDIRNRATCETVACGIDVVLHQAALCSIPWSIENPLTTHDVNVTGFINMIDAARRAGVERFVYASSCAAYGDEPAASMTEDCLGRPCSPYAATKRANELYAAVYAHTYSFKATGLRYFNVYGPRQESAGDHASVIPKWIAAMLDGEAVTIFGDGETSRDYCFVNDAVQANIRAALGAEDVQGGIYNVAVGERTTLNQLFDLLRGELRIRNIGYDLAPRTSDFRPGDLRHSLANINKARLALNFDPTYRIKDGLRAAVAWYIDHRAAERIGHRRNIRRQSGRF